MQLAADSSVTSVLHPATSEAPSNTETPYSQYRIIRRNGAVVSFEPSKISIALTKAFLAVEGGQAVSYTHLRAHET